MPRTYEQILASLEVLEAKDFDNNIVTSDGTECLNSLTDELMTLPHPERAVRALFDVMERMPEADLGSPGALVHTLEKMRGHYEKELVESIKRLPTPLAIWMVNRILNVERSVERRKFWMDLIRFAADHPKAPVVSRIEAENFIRYQNG